MSEFYGRGLRAGKCSQELPTCTREVCRHGRSIVSVRRHISPVDRLGLCFDDWPGAQGTFPSDNRHVISYPCTLALEMQALNTKPSSFLKPATQTLSPKPKPHPDPPRLAQKPE